MAAHVAGGAGPLRRVLEGRGAEAFRSFVRRADDRRLERTIGTAAGLRLIFSAMQRRFVPSRAGGFTGDVLCELRASEGGVLPWTVSISPGRAVARRGRPAEPQLTVRLTVADFVRLAARDLDAGQALLSGRLDLEGDFALATRLGGMFGREGL